MHNAPFTETRPWGEFREYAHNQPVTVKTILVKKGQALSLQYHHKRSEFWRVLSGHPLITVDMQVYDAKPADEFFIEAGMRHRISAPEDEVEILEVAFGEFDEEDIVRLEDNYGRA